MLSKPYAGWTNICIGEFSDVASYLDNVPVMILEGFITYYTTANPFCVEFDAEGYDWVLVLNHFSSMAVYYDKVIELNASAESLAEEAIRDIEENFDLWCRWNPGGDESEEYDEQKQQLTDLLETLKKLKSEQENETRLLLARWNS